MTKIIDVFSRIWKYFGSFVMEGGAKMQQINSIQQLSSIQLSKYILNYFKENSKRINHLKLQKLVYYVDAWHYVFLERPLIREEFEAWMHGPVVRELWDHYKEESILTAPISADEDTCELQVTEEQMEIINDVLEEYGNKTPYYLECLTHEEAPWITARKGCAPSDKCTNRISKEEMKEFYSKKLHG